MFIELTRKGLKRYICVSEIACIQEDIEVEQYGHRANRTLIILNSGQLCPVDQPYKQVLAMMDAVK